MLTLTALYPEYLQVKETQPHEHQSHNVPVEKKWV
eukprot:COSAG02_NODE_1513_length_12207_cov_3.820240_7_plen_35_part_00